MRDDTQTPISFQDLFEMFKQFKVSRPHRPKHISDIERKLIRHMNESTEPTHLRRLLEKELQRYMLFREPDLILETDRVVVSTIHRAKGLEFDVVIVPDCHSSNFPSYYANTVEEIQEDARLLFVAITRAIRTLVVLQPQSFKTKKGFNIKVVESQFLSNLRGYFNNIVKERPQARVVTRVAHTCEKCGRTWSWDGSVQHDNRCFGCGYV